MVKFFLLAVLAFGAFMAFAIFLPQSFSTAFHAFSHPVPWIALGVVGVGYIGYRAIK